MKTQHTQGSWFTYWHNSDSCMIISDSNDTKVIAELNCFNSRKEREMNTEELEANVRLIEASPDLLKIAIDRLQNMNGLATENRLNPEGIKEHKRIQKLLYKFL